jgi:hypothetical protein
MQIILTIVGIFAVYGLLFLGLPVLIFLVICAVIWFLMAKDKKAPIEFIGMIFVMWLGGLCVFFMPTLGIG